MLQLEYFAVGLFKLFWFLLFIYFLPSSCCPPPSSPSHSSSFHSSSPSPPVTKRMSPHPTRPLYSLGPQVSQGLGASSPTEARQTVLCYICSQGPQTSSSCMLPGWWLCLRALKGLGQLRLLVFLRGRPPP